MYKVTNEHKVILHYINIYVYIYFFYIYYISIVYTYLYSIFSPSIIYQPLYINDKANQKCYIPGHQHPHVLTKCVRGLKPMHAAEQLGVFRSHLELSPVHLSVQSQ